MTTFKISTQNPIFHPQFTFIHLCGIAVGPLEV